MEKIRDSMWNGQKRLKKKGRKKEKIKKFGCQASIQRLIVATVKLRKIKEEARKRKKEGGKEKERIEREFDFNRKRRRRQ